MIHSNSYYSENFELYWIEAEFNLEHFLSLQIDPAYILHAGGEGETDAGLLYTLHKGVAISGKPLDDEDEEARQRTAELRDKMEWLRSLEGR